MRKKELDITISEWRMFYESKGIKQEMIDVYLEYVRQILVNNVPVIFDFEHLSLLLRLDKEMLASMVNAPESFYRQFSIPKRSGGTREITAPFPSLKVCPDLDLYKYPFKGTCSWLCSWFHRKEVYTNEC